MTNLPDSTAIAPRFFCCPKAFEFNPDIADILGAKHRPTVQSFIRWLSEEPRPKMIKSSDIWYGLADTGYILRVERYDKESEEINGRRWYIASQPRWPPASYLGLEAAVAASHSRLNGNARPPAPAQPSDFAQTRPTDGEFEIIESLRPDPAAATPPAAPTVPPSQPASEAAPAALPAQPPRMPAPRPRLVEFDLIDIKEVSRDQHLPDYFFNWERLSPLIGYRCSTHNTVYQLYGKLRRKMSERELETARMEAGYGDDVDMRDMRDVRLG